MATDAPLPKFKWEWEGDAHKPLEGSIKAFKEIEEELKAELINIRHNRAKHAPDYITPVENLSDDQLIAFTADDFVLVRVATAINGNKTLFGKVRIPASDVGYIHFRAHVSGDGAKFHSIHTELDPKAAIFSKNDELTYFET